MVVKLLGVFFFRYNRKSIGVIGLSWRYQTELKEKKKEKQWKKTTWISRLRGKANQSKAKAKAKAKKKPKENIHRKWYKDIKTNFILKRKLREKKNNKQISSFIFFISIFIFNSLFNTHLLVSIPLLFIFFNKFFGVCFGNIK